MKRFITKAKRLSEERQGWRTFVDITPRLERNMTSPPSAAPPDITTMAKQLQQIQCTLTTLTQQSKEVTQPLVQQQRIYEDNVKQYMSRTGQQSQRVNISEGGEPQTYFIRKKQRVTRKAIKVTMITQALSRVLQTVGSEETIDILNFIRNQRSVVQQVVEIITELRTPTMQDVIKLDKAPTRAR